jgi:hypothetical protein
MEKYVQFVECESITGADICTKILQFLREQSLPPSLCRAQTYDGAGNMAG